MQAWFTQLVNATQGIKQGTPTRGPRKPPVPPKPRFTPSAKKKLKFTTPTTPLSSEELAHELPFSEKIGVQPWDTPQERADTIKRKVIRDIRQKNHGQCQKESCGHRQKESHWLGQESLGLEIVENPLRWDANAVLRPVPERDDDDARNEAASYLMCKTSLTRRVLNFIGPVISIWALAPI